MLHFRSLDEISTIRSQTGQPGTGGLLTIGSFDGVHLGHQAILGPMVQQAHASGVPAIVVTFHPHPVEVLRGVDQPMYLTSPQERAHLLGELGIDAVVTLSFDLVMASLTAEEFMQKLVQALGFRELWAGADFRLGRNRQGDINLLRQIGQQLGYNVYPINTVEMEGRVSSSRIRDLIREGQVALASRLLGRPYSVEGLVVHGEARGRDLGFPTANVDYWEGKIVPAYGVYATWTRIGSRRLPSVTSVGVRPTFDNPPVSPSVEAFLIDFYEDLYGQNIQVEFLEFLRPELRFNTVQSLIDQMVDDTQKAREVLAGAS